MIRVLLIDDNKDILFNFKELFEINGYEAKIAFDGEEGFRQLEKSNFNVVVCDMNMPKMSGFQFMNKVVSDETLPPVPVIIHSGNLSELERLQFEKLGVAAFLKKGTPFEKFNEEILKILSN
jgi:CheY-like chemotaxis protein